MSNEREITGIEAIREALREEMRRDERVFIIGEEVATHPFRGFRDLVEEFGKERVINTPLAEMGFTGISIGAALAGMRPVVEIMFVDFVGLCVDYIVEAAAKMRYMSAGKAICPVTFRIMQGAVSTVGMHHAQSFEGWFMHMPGIHVVMPSTPYDVKGLLKTAIRENDPVVFFEHKRLHGLRGSVPKEEYVIPFGKADIKREGEDVTVIATSFEVQLALAAANNVQKEGISVEVIDPRTLIPLDKETLLNSVKKTGRVVIVHEEAKTGGTGAEIAAILAEEAFDYLDGPIKRLGSPFTPFPYASPMEDYYMSFTSTAAISKAIREITRKY